MPVGNVSQQTLFRKTIMQYLRQSIRLLEAATEVKTGDKGWII